MLAQELWAGVADDGAEGEGDDDRVVELAGDGDEVRDQVERHGKVAHEGSRSRLLSLTDADDCWEVAYAALFFISDESVYVNAQALAVDSGITGL